MDGWMVGEADGRIQCMNELVDLLEKEWIGRSEYHEFAMLPLRCVLGVTRVVSCL